MERIIQEILQAIGPDGTLEAKDVDRVLAARNRIERGPVRRFAKKHIMPYYLKVKSNDPELWNSWNISPAQEAALVSACRMKPRRTSSGVATITVITKPWKCASNCLYCPNDIRMPKSYLSNEPACQRAERNYFDPYLQVASRLRALIGMGHETSKIELIILGGTFCDYPEGYQTWFIQQLFQALNDGAELEENAKERRAAYKGIGIENDAENLSKAASRLQGQVNEGRLSYNQAVRELYHEDEAWQKASDWQTASDEELQASQKQNETSNHRVVGLVVETRPDTVTPESLRTIRKLGCTKLQMGIQSIDPKVLSLNRRGAEQDFCQAEKQAVRQVESAKHAIDLARLFGFKIHTHFMLNLLGSTPEQDKQEYQRFMALPEYQPDEVKIYPCSLVGGTGLEAEYERGNWRPYSEEELIDVLSADVSVTPEFTRISRMIRDISAQDILVGNKKGNLRQLVDEHIAREKLPVHEIRFREINNSEADFGQLSLEDATYRTLHTTEHFLQWVTPQNQIAGFLRLSLPDQAYVAEHPELSVTPGQAMIREVHVYGRVARIQTENGEEQKVNAQHSGLGKSLVERACQMAKEQGFREINVISSIGTREYYRKLGFSDGILYQTKTLETL